MKYELGILGLGKMGSSILYGIIKTFTYKEKILGLTLSVGIGVGNNLSDCEKIARKSLDMAMGRGGDQAVLKTPHDTIYCTVIHSTHGAQDSDLCKKKTISY